MSMRLNTLKAETLEFRRLKFDLVTIYKILHGHTVVSG